MALVASDTQSTTSLAGPLLVISALMRGFASDVTGQHHAREDAALASRLRCVGKPGLEHSREIAKQVGELGIVEPVATHAVAHAIAQEVDVAAGDVAVEVAEQSGHETHERLAVLVRAHRGELVEADAGRGQAQHVRAFHRAADPPLGDDREDPGVDQASHVSVEARRGDVRELGAKFARRQRAITEERLHDPQPYGMQQ